MLFSLFYNTDSFSSWEEENYGPVFIIVSIIILRRIISLVSLIIFNIIPGLFVTAFSGDYVGLTFGRGLSGGYKMRLAGRGIVDPVYAAISQRCFHTLFAFPDLSEDCAEACGRRVGI